MYDAALASALRPALHDACREAFTPSFSGVAAILCGLRSNRAQVLVWIVAALIVCAIWLTPSTLSTDGRAVLSVLTLCIAGWTASSLTDTTVAITGVVALSVSGSIDADQIYTSLGHELIWLMLAAFVMASVLKASGLIERCLLAICAHKFSVAALFYVLTAAISATALVIPSTSGRAALLLPVFLALASKLRHPPLVRALSLMFPTVILLSASGSLIGAGAHALAAGLIEKQTGQSLGYLSWMALTMPIALLSSFAATWIILHAFLTKGLRQRHVTATTETSAPWTNRQRLIMSILLITVLLWCGGQWHQLGLGVVALAGAAAMVHAAGPLMKSKDAFKSVEVELLVFLAVTFALANALTSSKADQWLAQSILHALPAIETMPSPILVALVALISLFAHLVVASRTARASILLPAIVLPLAGITGDVTTLVLVTIVGTGLCQTMTASSKPVAIFATAPIATYTSGDLIKLSLMLFPVMFALIMVFATCVWSV